MVELPAPDIAGSEDRHALWRAQFGEGGASPPECVKWLGCVCYVREAFGTCYRPGAGQLGWEK